MTAFVNNTKTAILLGALFALFGVVGMYWGTQGLIIGLVLGGFMNVIAFFYSDKIAIAAMRGQQVGPEHRLHQLVDDLRQRAGLPMPKVYICPHQAPNAFATGRSPKKAAVAVTAGALQLLSTEELRGVMAHELAHVKNRDTLTSCIAATIAGTFSVLAYSMLWIGTGNRQSNPLVMILVLFAAMIGSAMLKSMISRSREYVADADGAAIAGGPHGLVSALQKLESYSRRVPLRQPNPAMNNLFIVEPFSGETLTKLFASHPPTASRVRALLEG